MSKSKRKGRMSTQWLILNGKGMFAQRPKDIGRQRGKKPGTPRRQRKDEEFA